MKRFYEACDVNLATSGPQPVLLLTRTDRGCEYVRTQRPLFWAVYCCRFTAVPADSDSLRADDDAVTLTMVMNRTRCNGLPPYARVIILQEGPDDPIDDTVGFFRTWLPSLLEEKRLFVSMLNRSADQCDAEELERAVQQAQVVM